MDTLTGGEASFGVLIVDGFCPAAFADNLSPAL